MRRVDGFAIVIILTVLTGVITLQFQAWFQTIQQNHPFGIGFLKFASIAIIGDFLAARLREKHWHVSGFLAKMVVWGLIGMSLVIIFPLFELGVRGVFERFGWPEITLLMAFLMSLSMNVFFAPLMMGFHRLTDGYIDAFVLGQKTTFKRLIETMAWPQFLQFTLGKTIPFFWLPAHTLTFLMPEGWRVVYAALLGVSLGFFQGILRRQKA